MVPVGQRFLICWWRYGLQVNRGLPDDVYARMRQHFSEVDATHLTFAVALMNALNRIAVGLRRAPAKKTSS